MKHRCHLPGCEAPCPPRHLFCRPHWDLVPASLQAEVYETVKQRGPLVDKTWAPWWRAQARATAHVLRSVHAGEAALAWAAQHEARGLKFADELEADD